MYIEQHLFFKKYTHVQNKSCYIRKAPSEEEKLIISWIKISVQMDIN